LTTELQSFRATVEHRQPGSILYRAGFTADLERRLQVHTGTDDLAGYYGLADLGGVSIPRPEYLSPPDYSSYWEGTELPQGTTINADGVAMVPSGYYHFWGYLSPLRDAQSLSDLECYPVEDTSGWDVSRLRARVDERHAEGKLAGAHLGHMYETAWQVRGYEQFLIDMVERPAWAECLLERLMERNLLAATAYAEAGVDLILCGDDVANQNALMFAPKLWRGMIHSRWQRVWETIKSIHPACRIWYHSDGNIAQIVGELVAAGVDILNPLQPECLDIDRIHRRYGHQLTFDGCIGTQSTMPFGTPTEVRRRVKQVIDNYGREGGLIISPTHVLEPDVPLENVDTLFAACREYGNFDGSRLGGDDEGHLC
jgi:uroporphyrinogen decarboxylase